MQDLKRSIGGTVLVVAAAGAGAVKPLWAGGGYCHAPCNAPSRGGYYHTDAGPHHGFWNLDLQTAFERMRKQPFEHKAYNPGDLHAREVCPPYCPPYWGYFEPRWRQLPAPGGPPAPLSYDVVPVPEHGEMIPPPVPAGPPEAPTEIPSDFPPIAPPTSSAEMPQINPGPRLTSDGWTAHRPRQ